MKITKTRLKQIIKEELDAVLAEAPNKDFIDPDFEELPDAEMADEVPGEYEAEQAERIKRQKDARAERQRFEAARRAAAEQCKDARNYRDCMGVYADSPY
tara:strand:- start:547 stop:846 length:300 start_codon:yes stop_codon:yes gene_type:complete